MGFLLPFGLLLVNAVASEFGDLRNIRLLNATNDYDLASQKYIDFVMDYLNNLPPEVEGPYGPLVFDSTTLRCAENSLQGLPKLTTGNSRDEVYQHMMAGLFLLRDENALDAIKAAMTSDAWIYNGVFVMETMLIYDVHFASANNGAYSDNPDSWSFSAVNWTITGSKDAELSKDYMADILEGHPFSADFSQLFENIQASSYENILEYSSASGCIESGFMEETMWTCPLGSYPDLICPGGCYEAGCTSEVITTEYCSFYNHESFDWGISPLAGTWGMDWFEDQIEHLEWIGALSLSASQKRQISNEFAKAIASMTSFSYDPDAGEEFASAIQDWFDQNKSDFSTTVSEILQSGAYKGLDWLLTAGTHMTPYFGGNNRDNCGGAILRNGYWQIYDMIDVVRINEFHGISWDFFDNHWENKLDILRRWFSWLDSHIDKWGPNSQLFIDFWSMEEMTDALYRWFTDKYEDPEPTDWTWTGTTISTQSWVSTEIATEINETTTYSETTTTATTTTTTTTTTSNVALSMDQIPAGTKCQGNRYATGYVSPGRVVGGEEAVANSWPSIASLMRSDTPFCGGSLISNEYVLTAAQCCTSLQITMDNHGVSWRTKVRLGHHAQDDSPASPNRVESHILEITIHPDYNPDLQENDLCLLKIEQVTLNEDVDVVCLPAQGDHVVADDNNVNSNNHCLAAGWGFESESGLKVNELKSVQVKIYSDLWCISQAAIATTALFSKDVEFCAGWLGTGGRDTCAFDYGGPLVCIENGEPVQYGITSWGSGCGDPLNPGVYAEVAEFIRKGPFY